MRSTERIELAGGIGNQLFQFSAGIARSFQNGTPVNFDTSRVNHGVTSRDEIISNFVKVNSDKVVDFKFVKSKLPRYYDVATHRISTVRRIDEVLRPSYTSPVTGYDDNFMRLPHFNIARGYFQSWRYVDFLRKQNIQFELQIAESNSLVSKFSRIFDFDNDIAVHVRRGDYLRFKNSIGLLSYKYFLKAINLLGTDRKVVVFSDDSNIESEFPTSGNFVFTPELAGASSIETLVLIKDFTNIVISNSTFSWWGAVLGAADKNVVAPKKWFRALDDPIDLLPMSWQTIDAEWLN